MHRGQIFAFILALVGMGGFIYLVLTGHLARQGGLAYNCGRYRRGLPGRQATPCCRAKVLTPRTISRRKVLSGLGLEGI